MADGQMELSGFGGAGEVESEISRIMALEGPDRARELYVFLLGMRLSGERTTITVDKNHLFALKCISQMSGVSMAEIISLLISSAAGRHMRCGFRHVVRPVSKGVRKKTALRDIQKMSESQKPFE